MNIGFVYIIAKAKAIFSLIFVAVAETHRWKTMQQIGSNVVFAYTCPLICLHKTCTTTLLLYYMLKDSALNVKYLI